jgi:hypothetical protein
MHTDLTFLAIDTGTHTTPQHLSSSSSSASTHMRSLDIGQKSSAWHRNTGTIENKQPYTHLTCIAITASSLYTHATPMSEHTHADIKDTLILTPHFLHIYICNHHHCLTHNHYPHTQQKKEHTNLSSSRRHAMCPPPLSTSQSSDTHRNPGATDKTLLNTMSDVHMYMKC